MGKARKLDYALWSHLDSRSLERIRRKGRGGRREQPLGKKRKRCEHDFYSQRWDLFLGGDSLGTVEERRNWENWILPEVLRCLGRIARNAK